MMFLDINKAGSSYYSRDKFVADSAKSRFGKTDQSIQEI
jgi:hypothetical protein